MAAITELPILYSTLMVEAKLAGTKTMTRRTAGLHRINENPDAWTLIPARIKGQKDGRSYAQFSNYNADETILVKCPYGEVDGLLFGRETWNTLAEFDGKPEYDVMGIEDFVYKSGNVRIDKWKPGIHMPKAAARLWDRIVSIKLERAQDITNEDALKEGISVLGSVDFMKKHFPEYTSEVEKRKIAMYNGERCGRPPIGPSPVARFKALWEDINGANSWDKNPWVWVVETIPLSTTGRPNPSITIPEVIQYRINNGGAIKNGINLVNYPAKYNRRIPLKVKMVTTVMSDLLFTMPETDCPPAIGGNEYYVSVNSHGAVTVIFEDGRTLGLKPYEFEVTEYHK